MEKTMIMMIRDNSKSATLKGTDVYRSTDPNAPITNIYMKKGLGASVNITLTVGDTE